MKYKIWSAFFCIIFSSIALYAQSIDDQAKRLQAELENLISINQKLRREYDSLKSIKSSSLPRGYYLRLSGGFVENDSAIYRIIRDQVGGKQVYSIATFSNPVEAFPMASALRKLKLGVAEVVYHEDSPPTGSKLRRTTMEIED